MAYTIRFPEHVNAALDEMRLVEGVTKAELIRRAINFYSVKLEAINNKKRLYFESEAGIKELIMV